MRDTRTTWLCWTAFFFLIASQQAAFGFLLPQLRQACLSSQSSATRLWGGYGTAANYTWVEETFEIDVKILVPPQTRAKDIVFKALPYSVDLRLKQGDDIQKDVVLLDGTRKMRGRVLLDGTYWVISDKEDDLSKREITVTVEKNVRPPKDDFEVIDYDWKGVYLDDEEEVSERKYEEPEQLNVREYAASLGVDIDNINMSMVDKTMFTSGLNLTRSTMDELTKSGFVKEVTQQGDGTEYVTNEDGEAVPFSSLGDAVGQDEVRDATARPKIPFLDTTSPWHKAVPVRDLKVDPSLTSTSNDSTPTMETVNDRDGKVDTQVVSRSPNAKGTADPIDALTVNRLKEILRAQNLKVTGTKQELRDRLRNHVQSVLTNPGQQDENVEKLK